MEADGRLGVGLSSAPPRTQTATRGAWWTDWWAFWSDPSRPALVRMQRSAGQGAVRLREGRPSRQAPSEAGGIQLEPSVPFLCTVPSVYVTFRGSFHPLPKEGSSWNRLPSVAWWLEPSAAGGIQLEPSVPYRAGWHPQEGANIQLEPPVPLRAGFRLGCLEWFSGSRRTERLEEGGRKAGASH